MIVAALYVLEDGPYSNLPDVELWGVSKDAREYEGPHPVVAHPPCARWGRYWSGNPRQPGKYKLGDDDGCFEAALVAVRRYGGVLEHPDLSHAYKWFGLNPPPYGGGWVPSGLPAGGWTCRVEQGHYGHLGRKGTWLYAVGTDRPELKWGSSGQRLKIDPGCHSREEYEVARRCGRIGLMSHKQRMLTPEPFRDLLLAIARTARL